MKHYIRESKDGKIKYYYSANGETVEISEAIYKCNRKSNDEERKQKRKIAQNNVLSLNMYSNEDDFLTAATMAVENMEDSVIRKLVLKEAIKKLPPMLQKVILLYFWHGYTYKEISVLLHVSERTVRRNFNLACQKIKEFIDDNKIGGTQA